MASSLIGRTNPRLITPYVERHLVATSTTTQQEWFTPWYLATGLDTVKAVVKAYNCSGSNFQYQGVLQTAQVRPDNPNTPVTFTSPVWSSGGENASGVCTISGQTGTQMWVRFGIQYSSTSGVAEADVALQVSCYHYGVLLDKKRVTLSANDTGNRIEVVSRWIPMAWVAKVKAAFVVNGITGSNNLQFRLTYMTATTSVQQPNSAGWSTTYDAWRSLSGSTGYYENNTGELASPSTNDMWIRYGVLYNLSSGTTQTTATLHCLTSIRL